MHPSTRTAQRLSSRALRGLAVAGATLGIASSLALIPATQASAATDTYCSGCQILNGSANAIYDRYGFYLVGSYVHYLGTGDRLLGAGAIDYANFMTGNNEVYHPYGGDHYAHAAAVNLSGHSAVTVNAHANY